MFDTLQILLWSVTYVCIIIAGIRNIYEEQKIVSMPYIAGICNFAWEICALRYSAGFYGHVLWFGLDTIIFYLNYKNITAYPYKCLYLLSFILTTLMLTIFFDFRQGMLVTVFIIDFVMAVSFIAYHKMISKHLKLTIAILKLFGDFFAGLYYFEQSIIVAIITVVVFIINCLYVRKCCFEKYYIKEWRH